MKSKQSIHKELHKRLISLLYKAGAGHIGSCLSCLDILIEVLVFGMDKNDKFILSKGHAAPALYIVLNHLGVITDKELDTFHINGTKLGAHTPQHYFTEHIPFATGSLGHGLSLSVGIAHAYKSFLGKKNADRKVFCLISDGECNEGQVWEAAQYAAHFNLSNLIVLLDKNKLQALGALEDVLGDSASVEKWKAFGFEVFESSGHKLQDMSRVIDRAKKSNSLKPKIIIFDTVKGHGIDFMENKFEWHYHAMSKEQFEDALLKLEKMYEK